MDFKKYFLDSYSKMGGDFNESNVNTLFEFMNVLIEHNKHVNLTAIRNEKDIIEKHFLDSLSISQHINLCGKNVLDIGCGAGFPGIVLKIMNNDFRLTLIDSTNKKINFIKSCVEEFNLPSTFPICSRAEDRSELFASFDIVVSRAVAPLNILLELSVPFLNIGGRFVAMKSINSDAEIKESYNALKILNANIIEIIDYDIPNTDITHRLIIIEKFKNTHSKYPRKYNKIQLNPL